MAMEMVMLTAACSKAFSAAPMAAGHQQEQAVVVSPCAACKILRRRCGEKCVLAPYFPPTDPLKFTVAHRVFGASNIIKLLQELPERQRADAVSSMVYEANARLRDPIYGSAGAICTLQNQLSRLQAELAKSQAEIAAIKSSQAHLLALLCTQVSPASANQPARHLPVISTSSTSPSPSDNDRLQLESPLSDDFFNFYTDESDCSLGWEML